MVVKLSFGGNIAFSDDPGDFDCLVNLKHRDVVTVGAKGAIAHVNFEDFQKIARMHQILMEQYVNILHFLMICTHQFEFLKPPLSCLKFVFMTEPSI